MKAVFWIAFLAAIGVSLYAGYMLFMPEYQYRMFKSDIEQIPNFDISTVKQFNRKIMDFAENNNLELDEKQIKVMDMGQGKLEARIKWSRTVDLQGYYKKTYDFEVHAAN